MSLGKLNIVGIGPGNDDHITPAALQAIKEAHYVIGYTTYINLVRSHLDGKQVTRTGMTEEIKRAQIAVETARFGNVVTLISSGDSGVYGMAGLVFEVLKSIGWTREQSPEVRLIPGMTAANSCASLVGAPLIHDSCFVSLSDLLTPWAVIENRLECAAKADFVISLYNPASGRRQRQIVEAARIIKQYRAGTTPVALVKSAYRKQQKVILSDLDHFLDFEIGMNTTVIVGNSNTFIYEGYMITPRGYSQKYTLEDGAVKEGQRAGFSLQVDGKASASVRNALSALEILAKPSSQKNVATLAGESQVLSFCGRLAGAIVFKTQDIAISPQSLTNHSLADSQASLQSDSLIHSRYYLVGNLKEPCDFEFYGFGNASLQGNWTELFVLDPEKVQKLNFNTVLAFHGEKGAQEIYNRFAILRNSSISERLVSLVKEVSPTLFWEGKEMVDARWLSVVPEPVWSMVKESVLKCL